MPWRIRTIPPCEGKIIGGVLGWVKSITDHIFLGVPETIRFTALRFDPLGIFEIQALNGVSKI